MSEVGYNVWGVVAGAIGIVTALIPACAFWYLGRFPTSKLSILEALLNDMDRMFQEGIREGLIYEEEDLRQLHSLFWLIKVRIDDARAHVYEIQTWKDELRSWWRGLSGKIHYIYRDACKLRSKLIKTSLRGREALAAAGHTVKLASLSGMQSRAVWSIPSLSSPSLLPSSLSLGTHEAPLNPLNTINPHIFSGEAIAPDLMGSSPNESCPASATRHADIAHSRESTPLSPTYGSVKDTGGVPYHVVPEADLKDLLSLALTSPPSLLDDYGADHHRRAPRKEVLLRFGRQLYGPDFSPPASHTASPRSERVGIHGRFGAFSRLLWCSYSARLHGAAGETTRGSYVASESSTPQHAGAADYGARDVD